MNNFAFIDSQNLNLAIQAQGWRLDFKRFRRYLLDKYKVHKAFIFIGYLKENEKLYQYLTNSGYILVYKPVVKLKNNRIKGNIDAELVLYTMIHFQNFDQAVIVSNDGDFYCLIKYLKLKNKLRRVIIPHQKAYSFLLNTFREDIDYMNNLKEKLQLSSSLQRE